MGKVTKPQALTEGVPAAEEAVKLTISAKERQSRDCRSFFYLKNRVVTLSVTTLLVLTLLSESENFQKLKAPIRRSSESQR